MGASPWGPYAHSTELSGIFLAAARRNAFVSHVELAVRAVQRRLARFDALVAKGARSEKTKKMIQKTIFTRVQRRLARFDALVAGDAR